jgi:diguanylate cyclase (GGDEF)-like protein
MTTTIQAGFLNVFIAMLASSGALGLLAMLHPRGFTQLASIGARWVGKAKAETVFDKRVNIDWFLIKNSRLFGSLVTLSVVYLSLLASGHMSPFWSPFFVLFIVGISALMGLLAILEIKSRVQQVEFHLAEARTDALTGLANRRAFDEEVERRLAEVQRHGESFCLLLIDIDQFKQINDTHGHLAGDSVLLDGVAQSLRNAKRQTDICARVGGDEFACILPRVSIEQGVVATKRLRQIVSEWSIPVDSIELQITLSMGLALAREGDTKDKLVDRADDALYAAKQAGRDCAYYHDGEQCIAVPTELSAASDS